MSRFKPAPAPPSGGGGENNLLAKYKMESEYWIVPEENLSSGVITIPNHGLTEGDEVVIRSVNPAPNDVPSNIRAAHLYPVGNITDDTFTLMEDGESVDFWNVSQSVRVDKSFNIHEIEIGGFSAESIKVRMWGGFVASNANTSVEFYEFNGTDLGAVRYHNSHSANSNYSNLRAYAAHHGSMCASEYYAEFDIRFMDSRMFMHNIIASAFGTVLNSVNPTRSVRQNGMVISGMYEGFSSDITSFIFRIGNCLLLDFNIEVYKNE